MTSGPTPPQKPPWPPNPTATPPQAVPYGYPPAYGRPPTPKAPNPAGAVAFVLGLLGFLAYLITFAITTIGSVKIMQEEMISTVPGMIPQTMPATGPTTFPRTMVRSMFTAQQRMMKKVRDFQMQPAVQVPTWSSMGLGIAGLALSIMGLRKPDGRRGLAVTGLVLSCLTCLCGVFGVIYTIAQAAVG